jgi:anti-sigma factor RsiW
VKRPLHLHDDHLFECYLAQRQGEVADPPTAEHLADCDDCAARYAELALVMDTMRAEGEAETDAIFTPDRLRAQQQQIGRRIEAVGRLARVISFPGRFVQRTIRVSTLRSPRWTAAAAAAGLFLGIALGASYEWEYRARPNAPALNARGGRLAPAAPRGSSADIAADADFLSELELALEHPRTRELAAFDAFTPHVREISDTR